MTMTIYLNDKPTVLPKACSVKDVLANAQLLAAPIAVALNQQFLPKAYFDTTVLKEGDKIDIITPMQGG